MHSPPEAHPGVISVPGRSAVPLTLRLFGPFELRLHGHPTPCLRSRKGQWLLALLALRAGRDVERDWLAGTLWPDSPEAAARANLRSSLKELRRALGEQACRLRSPTLRTLTLDLADADVDVLAFDALACGDRPGMEEAVGLYRGPLLEGCVEAWAFQERQVREQAYLEALDRLAEHTLASGNAGAAECYLRQAVAVDPLRETAQRGLMRALAAGGNEAAALRVYQELRLLLRRELNTEPDAETQALFEQLRAAARRRAGSSLRSLPPPARVPASSLPHAPRNNLPLPLTRFIGRELQMDEIHRLLDRYRLVTLTGAGGCGKSRLAIEVARDRMDAVADGVWLVELASLADPGLVPQALAGVLDVPEGAGQPLTTTLADALRARECLLVLDNCEHLAEACARLAETLLQACPQVRILVTSREPLSIGGEALYRVPSLSLPDLRRAHSVEHLMHSEAVRLFVERAAMVSSVFMLTDGNGATVGQICCRLDGIPLALELAAARVKALPVETIAARLDNRFRLLTGGSRTALPRHRTLRALIDWDYDLLSQDEQTLLRRLSVFVGGWTLEAAEGVWGDDRLEAREVLDLLTSLVEKSLVVYEEQDGQARYRLLETVRQYGRDRLVDSGEIGLLHAWHRDWFLRFAERAEPELIGPEQVAWFARLKEEHDNLRVALAWSAEQDEVDAGLRLAGALWRFWSVQGHWREGSEWLAAFLAQAGPTVRTTSRAKALLAAGDLFWGQGERGRAIALFEAALALSRELGDKSSLARSLFELGHVAVGQGVYERAEMLFEESLALARELENGALQTYALDGMGHIAELLGNDEMAHSLYAESLALARSIGNTRQIAWMLIQLGDVAEGQREYERAASLGEESLALAQTVRGRVIEAYALELLARVAWRQGEYERAATLGKESLARFQEHGDRWMMAACLRHLGEIACRQGEHAHATALHRESIGLLREFAASARADTQRLVARCVQGLATVVLAQRDTKRAARLLGAAEALREAVSAVWLPAERADYQQCVMCLRAALGDEAFATAWADGQAMTLEATIACALELNRSVELVPQPPACDATALALQEFC